jgi:hypothetical protein
MNKRGMAVLAAMVTVSFAGARAMADWDKPSTWPPVKTVASWFKSDHTDVLVVTGNYLKPRLLAEMIQQRNGAPILLFSPAADGGTRVFFMPPGGADAVEIGLAGVPEFVKNLNPKKAVVLGDTRYVPEASQEAVKACVPADGFIPFVDGDWAGNAKTITGLLKLKGLDARYARRLQDIDGVLGPRPATPAIAEPDVTPAAAPEAEPMVEPAAPAETAPAEPEVAPTPAAAAPKKAEAAPVEDEAKLLPPVPAGEAKPAAPAAPAAKDEPEPVP